MQPNDWRDLNSRSVRKIADITQQAEAEFAKKLAAANAAYRNGAKAKGVFLMDIVIRDFGIRDLVRRAEEAKAAFK